MKPKASIAARLAETPAAPLALKGLFAIGLIYLLKLADTLLIPIAVAVILTFLLSPVVRALRRRGLDDAIGAAVVVGGALAVIGAIGSTLVGPATAWWERAPSDVQQLADTVDRVRRSIPLISPPPRAENKATSRARPEPLLPTTDPVKEKLATEGVAFTGAVVMKLGPPWYRRSCDDHPALFSSGVRTMADRQNRRSDSAYSSQSLRHRRRARCSA
jgi:hypothetical protein